MIWAVDATWHSAGRAVSAQKTAPRWLQRDDRHYPLLKIMRSVDFRHEQSCQYGARLWL